MNSHDSESGSLTIEYSEVKGCGNGVYSHQLYASQGQIDPAIVFTLRYTYVHDGQGGNAIKSRFPSNVIQYNWYGPACGDDSTQTLTCRHTGWTTRTRRSTGPWS